MLQGERGSRDGGRAENDDGRMPEREHESNGYGTLAVLHQLARHVVDRGDMIGVDGVTQAEAVGQQRGS